MEGNLREKSVRFEDPVPRPPIATTTKSNDVLSQQLELPNGNYLQVIDLLGMQVLAVLGLNIIYNDNSTGKDTKSSLSSAGVYDDSSTVTPTDTILGVPSNFFLHYTGLTITDLWDDSYTEQTAWTAKINPIKTEGEYAADPSTYFHWIPDMAESFSYYKNKTTHPLSATKEEARISLQSWLAVDKMSLSAALMELDYFNSELADYEWQPNKYKKRENPPCLIDQLAGDTTTLTFRMLKFLEVGGTLQAFNTSVIAEIARMSIKRAHQIVKNETNTNTDNLVEDQIALANSQLLKIMSRGAVKVMVVSIAEGFKASHEASVNTTIAGAISISLTGSWVIVGSRTFGVQVR